MIFLACRWSFNQQSKIINLQSQISRAGDGIRTREYQLGRLMPYHLATPAFFRAPDFTVSGVTGQADLHAKTKSFLDGNIILGSFQRLVLLSQ
jgi:hypothetical protein